MIELVLVIELVMGFIDFLLMFDQSRPTEIENEILCCRRCVVILFLFLLPRYLFTFSDCPLAFLPDFTIPSYDDREGRQKTSPRAKD